MFEINHEDIQRIIEKLKQAEISPKEDSYEVIIRLNNINFREIDNYTVDDGASKICIVFKNLPYVIKWSMGYEDSEAMEEVQFYKDAERQHLERFFPQTQHLTTIGEIEFVIQEKVDFDAHALSYNLDYKSYRTKYMKIVKTASPRIIDKVNKKTRESCHGSYARDLDRLWVAMALVLYGKKAVKVLCEFIINHNINDLHNSNIGYLNDRPIILDFSGFHRD